MPAPEKCARLPLRKTELGARSSRRMPVSHARAWIMEQGVAYRGSKELPHLQGRVIRHERESDRIHRPQAALRGIGVAPRVRREYERADGRQPVFEVAGA